MIARDLISQLLTPLRTSDSGEDSLTIMNIFHVKHLPIVNEKMLLGTISEDDILSHDLEEPIGSYGLSLNKAFANESDHLFEVMGTMAESKLTTIPVVGEDEIYQGIITQEDLIQYYAKSFSFSEPGSIIVIEIDRRDYSLAEISRIIEMENAAILSSFLTLNPDSTKVYVTVKVNQQDIQHIVATLQRFEYQIKASFTENSYIEDLKEHYDSLMSYLNV